MRTARHEAAPDLDLATTGARVAFFVLWNSGTFQVPDLDVGKKVLNDEAQVYGRLSSTRKDRPKRRDARLTRSQNTPFT